jgi:hypothetical protein
VSNKNAKKMPQLLILNQSIKPIVMTRKFHFFAGVALIATMLTACSNQKFAFRKKLKADKQETVAAKKTGPASAPTVNAVAATNATPENNEAVQAESPAAKAEVSAPVASSGTKALSVNRPAGKVKAGFTEKQLNKAKQLSTRIEDRLSDTSIHIEARTWIIVGLIIFLIGIVFAFVHPVGGAFIAVGLVIALIGLIFLLVDHI